MYVDQIKMDVSYNIISKSIAGEKSYCRKMTCSTTSRHLQNEFQNWGKIFKIIYTKAIQSIKAYVSSKQCEKHKKLSQNTKQTTKYGRKTSLLLFNTIILHQLQIKSYIRSMHIYNKYDKTPPQYTSHKDKHSKEIHKGKGEYRDDEEHPRSNPRPTRAFQMGESQNKNFDDIFKCNIHITRAGHKEKVF